MHTQSIFVTACLITSTFAHPQYQRLSHRAVQGTSQTPTYTFDQLYNLTDTFMQHYMYPNNIKEAASINSTLLSDDILGRVEVTRDYAGRELNTEYLFGLFANIALNPDSFTLLGYPVNYKLTKFTANQNIVSFAAIIDYQITAINATVPQELDFWITFNSAGQISQYDGTFRYLQWQLDTLTSGLQKSLNATSAAQVQAILKQKLAQGICATASKYCNGTNTQYDSNAACQDHLINDVRFGSAYEWGMNTVTCRMLHQSMVPLRPDVHCPHIGPAGGGMCVDDRTYAGNVLEDYFVNTPFIPSTVGNGTA